MTRPVRGDARLLSTVEADLTSTSVRYGSDSDTARLELLEAASASFAGYRREALHGDPVHAVVPLRDAEDFGRRLASRLKELSIPVPVALSSLAQPAVDLLDRRRRGIFYTDYRLAGHLAKVLLSSLPNGGSVLDPACGSGILLAALASEWNATDGVSNLARLRGVDLSRHALRAARMSLAAASASEREVEALVEQIVEADSLDATPAFWRGLLADGVAGVIGNPPWEKLKITRHELLLASGVDRHYGATYAAGDFDDAELARARAVLGDYITRVATGFGHQGSGETDLYKLFLELGLRLLGGQGHLAMLVPAGLLRNAGAERLRRHLFDNWDTDITVFDNRAAFFDIDTRFKFVSVAARPRSRGGTKLRLRHAQASIDRVEQSAPVTMSVDELARLRPDLTVPEVRSGLEWALFARLFANGRPLGSHPEWSMDMARELDMTNDRAKFVNETVLDGVPVVEGRMVHQFRFPAKAYRSGTGRRARWVVAPSGARVEPQFWVRRDALDMRTRERISSARVGFCDVTGQTNERTILAALIPSGVVCGNKVPTIDVTYAGDGRVDPIALWTGIANSFVFDWLARRVITTSLNFFVLRSLAFPHLSGRTRLRDEIASLSAEVTAAGAGSGPGPGTWEYGMLRARLDAAVAEAFGVTAEELVIVLADFQLLDGGQPPIWAERRATVTRDLVLHCQQERLDQVGQESIWRARVDEAQAAGAAAFIPSQHSRSAEEGVGEPDELSQFSRGAAVLSGT
jgi:SAM-dependent methyltransferase